MHCRRYLAKDVAELSVAEGPSHHLDMCCACKRSLREPRQTCQDTSLFFECRGKFCQQPPTEKLSIVRHGADCKPTAGLEWLNSAGLC